MKKMLRGLAGTSVLAASLLTAAAAPASAASTCSGSHLGNWSISGGYIAVYYNSATGRNCAMTRTNNPGSTQWIMVSISRADGSGRDRDGGYYRYYAGPVYVYAPNTCISFSGNVGGGPAEGVTNAYCD